MTRRERTTALPRPKPLKTAKVTGRRFAGITWQEHHIRLGILAVAAGLLLLVGGLFGYRLYDDIVARPNHIVLTVGDQKFKLSYYTDRLLSFVQANQSSQQSVSMPLLEEQLLSKLTDEALGVQLAKEKGVDLSDDAVTKEIASELGVPVGGPGSSFDTLYRAKLKSTGMSDGNYRRLAEANLANTKLLELFKADIPAKSEALSLRVIVTASKDEADKALERVKAGEDMGTVAQAISIDVDSKQNDGLMLPEPRELLPTDIGAAVKDKTTAAADLFGPIQVQTNWWVFRIDKVDNEFEYSDAQKGQLAQIHLDQAIKDKQAATNVKRNLTGDDRDWAVKNAN